MVEPGGVVFDSSTGAPVAGVQVILFANSGQRASALPDWPAGMPDIAVTDGDGAFSFRGAPFGSYFFTVDPGLEFQFPSRTPDGELPPGFAVDMGSRGEVFTLSAQNPSVNMDIPIDPSPGVLRLSKSCSKERAEIGDIASYELTLSNQGYSPITDLKIQDILPHGFLYKDGSTTIDGKPAEDPAAEPGRAMEWTIPMLETNATMVLGYRVFDRAGQPPGRRAQQRGRSWRHGGGDGAIQCGFPSVENRPGRVHHGRNHHRQGVSGSKRERNSGPSRL